MSDSAHKLRGSSSDCNLSLHKTHVSTCSDFVPNFCSKPNQDTDGQEQLESFRFNINSTDRPTRRSKSTQIDKKPPRPKQSITEIIQQASMEVLNKNRPRALSVSLGNNKKNGSSSGYQSYNSSLYLPQRPKTTKNAKVPRSRDGSPIVKSHMSMYIERRVQNRSVELKSIIGENNIKYHSKGKTAGKTVYNTTNQRKEIEKELSNLENRLKRLKFEESNTLKKMNSTTLEAEKTLAKKMRHKEDLATKELRSRKREESLKRKRQEISNEREDAKMNCRTAVLDMLKSRYNNAQLMRKLSTDGKNREAERRRIEDEKKRAVKDGIKTWIRTSKMMKSQNENLSQKRMSFNYAEKARIEKERSQDLLAKRKQMEQIEKDLLGKISQARVLHEIKLAELQDIKSINVKK